jgi:hypothetical protein
MRGRSDMASDDLLSRNPTTGIAACCARAASGHDIAALPRSEMKLRRFMQKCPSRTEPTKGHRCASQQNWRADVADGSFTSFSPSRRVRFTSRADIRPTPRYEYTPY